jgi:hypothetical protein
MSYAAFIEEIGRTLLVPRPAGTAAPAQKGAR